jgi:hypothetical protein
MKRILLISVFLSMALAVFAGGGSEPKDEPDDDDQLRYEGRETVRVTHVYRLRVTRNVANTFQDRRVRVNVGLRNVYSLGNKISRHKLNGYSVTSDVKLREGTVLMKIDRLAARSVTISQSSNVIQWNRVYDLWCEIIGSDPVLGLPIGYGWRVEDLTFSNRYDRDTWIGDRV